MLELLERHDDAHDWFAEQSAAFNGEAWRLRVPGQPDSIVFCLPEAIQEIWVDQIANFPKGSVQTDLLAKFFGHGIVASDGERWYHQRTTANKFFSAKLMHTFLADAVHKTLGRMSTLMDAAAAKNEAVDLKKLFRDFTLDTFVQMGFGLDLNCMSSNESLPLQVAIDESSKIIAIRFERPRWFWKLCEWLDVGVERAFTRYEATIRAWLSDAIQQSTAQLTAAQKIGETREVKNVIELFFESSRDDAEGIQHDDLIDFMQTFIIVARDTTSDTLSWLFYLLAKHPRVETKLWDELALKLGRVDLDMYHTTDDLRDLIYLDACIRETLRLYPALPYTYRFVAEDTVICGDIPLKKGELAGVFHYSMARLPRLWGDDAAEWNPDRWIDTATGALKPVPPYFHSFGSGPRVCIGKTLANLQLRAVAANLLHHYTFDVDVEANKGQFVLAATLAMTKPLMAKPSPAHRG